MQKPMRAVFVGVFLIPVFAWVVVWLDRHR
jgi:hypothetical protein